MNTRSVLSGGYSVCSVCNYKHKIHLYSHLDGAWAFGWGLGEKVFFRIPDIVGTDMKQDPKHWEVCVCRWINVAGLRLLFIERAAYKSDLLLASSIVALRMSPVNRKLCLDHLYRVLYAKFHFPSGSPGFRCTVGRCCLCDQPWRKAVGSGSGLPWAETWRVITVLFVGKERSTLWVSTHGKEWTSEAYKWISSDSAHVSLPCGSCCLSFCYNKP